METKDLLVYILKPSKIKYFSTFSFFILTIISSASSCPFVLYEEESEHKCDGNLFLSSIKNFTLDCTRYYDKLFTFSELKLFFKAATDTISCSLVTPLTIPAMGLGTCQENYAENCISLPALSKQQQPQRQKTHTQCCLRDKK